MLLDEPTSRFSVWATPVVVRIKQLYRTRTMSPVICATTTNISRPDGAHMHNTVSSGTNRIVCLIASSYELHSKVLLVELRLNALLLSHQEVFLLVLVKVLLVLLSKPVRTTEPRRYLS